MIEKTLSPLKANLLGTILILLITIPLVEIYIKFNPNPFKISLIKELNEMFFPLGYIIFVLGLFPFVLALLLGNFSILLFSILFTVAASGDFLMLYMLRIAKPNQYVQDHPSEVGFYLYDEK